jgi:hypothetical protein
MSNRSVRQCECEKQRVSAQGESRRTTEQAHVPLGGGGTGSHGTLYVGNRFTVVKDLKKELGAGLLSDMLKQLGIRKEDL